MGPGEAQHISFSPSVRGAAPQRLDGPHKKAWRQDGHLFAIPGLAPRCSWLAPHTCHALRGRLFPHCMGRVCSARSPSDVQRYSAEFDPVIPIPRSAAIGSACTLPSIVTSLQGCHMNRRASECGQVLGPHPPALFPLAPTANRRSSAANCLAERDVEMHCILPPPETCGRRLRRPIESSVRSPMRRRTENPLKGVAECCPELVG